MSATNAEDSRPLYVVTGGTGLVGAYLLRYMVREGYRVRAIRRPGSRTDLTADVNDALSWVEGDLLDPLSLEDALAGADTVIHCAALVSFLPADAGQLLRVNRDGTANLVDAALYQRVRRLVHVSSVAALGRRSGGEPIDEKTAWQYDPLAPRYSYSKFQAEREIWRGQAEGLSVAAVYPSLIFGSGWWKAGTNQLFAHADRELPFYPPGATGMVDVRDVARAILLLLARDRDGDRFLLNGENISYRALLEQIATALGRRAPRHPFRRWQAQLLLWAETLRSKITGRAPLITTETIRNSFQRYGYNNRHSCEELGLTYIPAAETIAETAAQYSASKAAGRPADVLPLR